MAPKSTEATPTERRSIIPALAGVVVLIGLGMGLAVEHQNRLALSEEQRALQQHLARVTELVAESERQASLRATVNPAQPPASDPAGDVQRLRTELSALRQLTNELERAHSENADAHAALDHYLTNAAVPKIATADFWPQDSWKFTGFATPDDALRSSLAASYNGDVKALLDCTTGEFRRMLDKEYEGKTGDEASIHAMDEVVNVKSLQMINREFQSEDTAVLTTAFEEGDQTQTRKLVLKKVGNEWKVAGMAE